MKDEMKFAKMLLAPLALALFTCAFAESPETPPLTLEEVRHVCDARYDKRYDKFASVRGIMERMRSERMRRLNQAAESEIELYLLNEIGKIEYATVEDYDRRSIENVYYLETYLSNMAFWRCMRETNNLLKVAHTIGRFKPLPMIDATEAMSRARKIDNYLAYGTNEPPQQGCVTRSLNGPITGHVQMVSDFRREYNNRLANMRYKLGNTYRRVIIDGLDDYEDLERQALWDEFVRVAGLSSETDKIK